MLNGLVLKSTGSWYDVLHEGTIYACRTRGKLRLKGTKTTNPIAVGDIVQFSLEKEGEKSGLIEAIEPRENYIMRQSIKKSAHGHIIAANIDQAVLIATLIQPRTSLGFIDRFLVTAEAFRIPQVIVFNKTDLLMPEGLEHQQQIITLYESIGVRCLETSALKNEGIESFKALLKGKKSLVSGHSGVGKSTLVNQIAPGIEQKTAEISDFSDKGVHTTTFAEMFEVEPETFIIDTPGIKELGLIEIEKEELSDYFPEMRALQNDCKFNNCLHLMEPGCAIKAALDEGIIYPNRYNSYLSMLEGEDNRR